jgi:hypothetical protein
MSTATTTPASPHRWPGSSNVGLNKETRDGSVAVLDTTDWSWTIPVERFTYTYPDDDLTQVPTTHRHVEHQGLFEWDTVDLADAEVDLDTYAGPVDPGTVESITAHRLTLQRVIGRQRGFGLRRTLAARRIARTDTPEGTDISARDKAAEQLTAWIRDDDIDPLATHLLDPRQQFNIYRHLSPIIELWGTEEIRLWAADAARSTE